MKRSKRILRVVVEADRTITFRNFSRQPVWCNECRLTADMVSVAEAARQTGLTELAVYQLVSSRTVHFAERENGHLLICRSSLPS